MKPDLYLNISLIYMDNYSHGQFDNALFFRTPLSSEVDRGTPKHFTLSFKKVDIDYADKAFSEYIESTWKLI